MLLLFFQRLAVKQEELDAGVDVNVNYITQVDANYITQVDASNDVDGNPLPQVLY